MTETFGINNIIKTQSSNVKIIISKNSGHENLWVTIKLVESNYVISNVSLIKHKFYFSDSILN